MAGHFFQACWKPKDQALRLCTLFHFAPATYKCSFSKLFWQFMQPPSIHAEINPRILVLILNETWDTGFNQILSLSLGAPWVSF